VTVRLLRAMSLRSALLLALPLCALAAGFKVAVMLWLIPLSWRLPGLVAGQLAQLSGLLLSVALPLAVYRLLTRSVPRRQPTWQVDPVRRALVAPASAVVADTEAIIGVWLGTVLPTYRVPGTDQIRLRHGGVYLLLCVAIGLVFLAVVVPPLFTGRPRLELDATGITVHRPWRTRTVAWDALVAGYPKPPGKWGHHLTLTAYEVSATGFRLPFRLPAGKLEIDPALLAVTIRRCIAVPETRTEIGTIPGLRHLIQDTIPSIGR
jgi:hypothetical protein